MYIYTHIYTYDIYLYILKFCWLKKKFNYITKKEEHKNFHKTKNVGIDAINKSYFIIFLIEPTCRKLWPRLKFLRTENVNYITKKGGVQKFL